MAVDATPSATLNASKRFFSRVCISAPLSLWRLPGATTNKDSEQESYSRPLLPRQHGRQKAEFGLHFGGIGHSVGDFLTKEFPIPLAKPVNGHLERSL